ADGIQTNLKVVGSSDNIYLFKQGGEIVGRVGNDANGAEAFRISINNSKADDASLKVTQSLPIDHEAYLASQGWKLGPNGHYYKFVAASGIDWADAKAAAEGMGGHLATATSAEENDFIGTQVIGGKRAWLGASDEATEGTFAWVTGET